MTQALLTSGDCRIWPYARGMYPAGTLHALWQAMQEDEALPFVMYDAEHQDLETLVQMLYPAALYIVTTPAVDTILGAVWFTELRAYRANINLWYAKRFRGASARSATDRICRFAFAQYGWRYIWGTTPWYAALRHGDGCGFQHVATVPQFFCVRGTWRPLYVACRERQEEGKE